MNCYHTNLLTLAIQVINSLNQGLIQGTHSNNYTLCIWCTIVIKYMMLTAGNLGQISHSFLNQIWNSLIIFVYSLTSLEINIIILSSTTDTWMIWIQCIATESIYCIPVQNLAQFLIRNNFNLLNLMGSTETIKEIKERNPSLNSNQMSNSSQIHNFLYRGLSQHSHTGLTGSHNILMVTKNVQRAGSQGTSTNVEYAWQKLTGNLVHIWNHQEHTLRCSIGSSQSTSLQGAMYSTSGASLRFHLYDVYLLAKQVFLALCCHFVYILSHWRRRRNRIDCSYISKCVRDIRSSGITIHSFHFFAHGSYSPLNKIDTAYQHTNWYNSIKYTQHTEPCTFSYRKYTHFIAFIIHLAKYFVNEAVFFVTFILILSIEILCKYVCHKFILFVQNFLLHLA